MINGFSQTSTDTTTVSSGAVLNSQSGFSGGPSGSEQSTSGFSTSFSSLLDCDTEASETLSGLASLTTPETQDVVSDIVEQDVADLSSDSVDVIQTTLVTTANFAQNTNPEANFGSNIISTAVSTMTDSIVSAVSNVMSTSATLATAQVATSQLATNSVLDGKLIEATAVKETTTSTDALANSNIQANRSEAASNLQFKAVLDRSLSAQELGERLSSTIADKVSVQVNAKVPTATIRLDPPDLGKIDLVIKLDNDKLNIQINATSGATRESIQMTSERLRSELMEQNFLHVDVSISGEHQQSSDHHEMMSDEDFIIAGNSVATDFDAEELIDNSELARA